jgi:hypothetical protein
VARSPFTGRPLGIFKHTGSTSHRRRHRAGPGDAGDSASHDRRLDHSDSPDLKTGTAVSGEAALDDGYIVSNAGLRKKS